MKTMHDNPFAAFLQHLHALERSPATIKAYASDLRHFQGWFTSINDEPLTPHNVTGVDLQAYRRHLLTKGKSPATVNRHLASVRAWLRWAKKQGVLEQVPEVSGVRKQNLAPRWLTPKEEMRLLRTAERAKRVTDPVLHFLAVRDWAVIVLLLHTGLRAAELVSLRLEDVILRPRSGHLIVRGKGRKERIVPLNRTARQALAEWLALRNERVPDGANPFVFVGQKWSQKKPLAPSTLWRAFRRTAHAAGVEASPHALRHTLAKRLVDRGVGLEKIAALLGHESLDTTRRYIEPGEEDLQHAVSLLE